MNRWLVLILLLLLATGLLLGNRFAPGGRSQSGDRQGRQEVVFWHFWGGADRAIVEDVVRRFNESQDRHFVRAIAMPGNNLQAKLFLAIAGGDPPDLVNQDDPIVGDWAWRNAIQSIDSLCSPEETAAIREHLFPAARKLGTSGNRLFGVCNGLDIRALYYNRTELEKHGLEPPSTIDELDRIARTICPPENKHPKTFGYLPDARRLWAWGRVFGGRFYDPDTRTVLLDQPPVVRATQWMARYAEWYGPDTINRFRQGDQSLPGKTFPLLPVSDEEMVGRYVLLMDGQWRVRDIAAFTKRRIDKGLATPRFGVCPLPRPAGGRADAGWVNGNFFVIPKGARNDAGAVAFIRFWIGLDDPQQAARTCAAGGWIPVSSRVVQAKPFQDFLTQQPLFAEFVRLARSENQFPIPVIPGAPRFRRSVEKAAAEAMARPDQSIEELLRRAGQRIQNHLNNLHRRR